MLDDRPILKDRLTATAVFTGIAIGAVAGFEMVIGGGFDFLLPAAAATPAPAAQIEYLNVDVASYEGDGQAWPVASYYAPEQAPNDAGVEDLAGAGQDALRADPIPTEYEVREEIAELYEPAPPDDASASESASPW